MERYITLGLSLGAVNVVPFKISDIMFDERTALKCAFGCTDWGKSHTCPYMRSPLSVWEYRKIFERFSRGLIIHGKTKQFSQRASLAIEKAAFLDGYYFAFSLSDCAFCDTCAGTVGKPCRNERDARPAFHSVGIDVFKTVHGLGLPLSPLKTDDDDQNWYSAVFIE